MRWKKIFACLTVCTALIVTGCLYLDLKLAEFISQKVGLRFLNSTTVSEIPDLLLLLVCVVTALSWAGRLYVSKKNLQNLDLKFLEYTGCAVPLAYILKDISKDLFGRTNTRIWLMHPERFGFHWFHGGGDFSAFPSGHMAVFTAMMLGVSRYFPRFRPACAGLLLTIALALIITEYHFFSDIMAGVSLGLIVDLVTCRGLSFLRRNRPQF